MTSRGLCAHCHRAMHVRLDGLLRFHHDTHGRPCPGGHTEPEPTTAEGRLQTEEATPSAANGWECLLCGAVVYNGADDPPRGWVRCVCPPRAVVCTNCLANLPAATESAKGGS